MVIGITITVVALCVLLTTGILLWQERRYRRIRRELYDVRTNQERIEANLKARDTAAEIIQQANAHPIAPGPRTSRRRHLRAIDGGLVALLLAALAGLIGKHREHLAFSLAAASAATLVVAGLFVYGSSDDDDTISPTPPAAPRTPAVSPGMPTTTAPLPADIFVIVTSAPGELGARTSSFATVQTEPSIATYTTTATRTTTIPVPSEITTTAPAPSEKDRCVNNPAARVCVILDDVGRLARDTLGLLGP